MSQKEKTYEEVTDAKDMKVGLMKSYDTQHNPEVWAVGSKYGPLQCCGLDYLCPDCGGYGYLLDKDKTCEFCNGKGDIALDDSRITTDEQINRVLMDVN